MTYRNRMCVSKGSSYEKSQCGPGSVGSFQPESSDTTDRTMFVTWVCTSCGSLYTNSATDADCTLTPPIKECVPSTKKTTSCRFERLNHYGSIGLSTRRPSCVSESMNSSLKTGNRRFERSHAGNAVREGAAEDVMAEESKGVRNLVMVGTFLAFWGLLIIAESAL